MARHLRLRGFVLWLLLGVLWAAPMVQGATYYVVPAGTDVAPCTQAQPCRTIAQGLRRLQPGDTLYLRGGTYHESISSTSGALPSGTSWATPITIAGHPGETVTLHPSEGAVIILNAYQNPHVSRLQYLIFDNLVIDAAGGGGGIGIYGNVSHIRFQNSEVKNARQQGIHGGAGASDVTFLNLNVHHNGSDTGDHGFYVCMQNTLIDGGEMHHNAGSGIQIYDKGQYGCANNTVIRHTRTYKNVTSGVSLSYGDNIEYCNNHSYDNGGGGVDVAYGNPAGTKLLNNTLSNNPGGGIQLMPGTRGTVIRNNRLAGNATPIADYGAVGTVQSGNALSAGDVVGASGPADCGGPSLAPAPLPAPPPRLPAPRNLRVIVVKP